jgi:hypothetical protein
VPVSFPKVKIVPKANEGWNGKSGILLARLKVKPVRHNAASPANTDRVKTVPGWCIGTWGPKPLIELTLSKAK